MNWDKSIIFAKTPVLESVEVTAPSNIAIVKYWGKHGIQLPNNPSLSLTLNNAVTKTKITIIAGKEPGFELLFESQSNPIFDIKVAQYFDRIAESLPFVKNTFFKIESENTFPHSSGIASSASSMSALSYGLLKLCGLEDTTEFKTQHSYLSRLGSGSASRSAYGGWAGWGACPGLDYMSDNYAGLVPGIHKNFRDYKDAILIVSAEKKEVSSTLGHQLMDNNPFAEVRYQEAIKNTIQLTKILQTGNLEAFVEICEQEALQLHALMMLSNPYFILLKGATLSIIEKTRNFRKTTNIPVAFTCDAGPNVHLLYPKSAEIKVERFIRSELQPLCDEQMVIWDKIGSGPKIISTN